MRYVDLTGERYERWLVISRVANGPYGQRRWYCRCDCGNYGTVATRYLTSGESQSCGCLQKELTAKRNYVHGHGARETSGRRAPEYRAWAKMTQRCTNPNDPSYPRYGGRGITFVKRWETFDNFYADMGRRPSEKYSLERKDGNGNYGPSNCIWATRKIQARNRPTFNHYVKYKGRTVTVTEAVEMAGNRVADSTARNRLKSGWTVEDAVELPALPRNSLPAFVREALRELARIEHCSLASYIVAVLTEHIQTKTKKKAA